MRRYETTFIVDPDQPDDQREAALERVTDLIVQHEGLLVQLDKWGIKKLAYEIKKKGRGYYVCVEYCGSGLLVDEIERFFRIDDRVLKYMTILLDKDADMEQIKEEIAQREEAQRLQDEAAESAEKAAQEAALKAQAEAHENAPEAPEAPAEPATLKAETDQPESSKEDS